MGVNFRPVASIPGQGRSTSEMRIGEKIRIPGWQESEAAQGRLRAGGPGYEAFSKYALSEPGQSPWEKMMMGRQATEEASARDLAQNQAAGAGQSAWSRMAMRGGGGSGARERALTGPDNFRAMQDVGKQGMLARSDIGLRGEEQRLGMLGQLPGMEYQREMGAEDLRNRDYENLLKRFALMKKDWASESMANEIKGL